MKKKWIFLLVVLVFLSGCSAPESPEPAPATVPTTAPPVQTEPVQTLPPPTTEEAAQPAEPELPWPSDVRWYGPYYFKREYNPDPKIVEGVVRFNSLLRNDGRETLTIVSAHADFYLGTEIVAREDYDSKRLPDFFFHPGAEDLTMEYGESKVLQIYPEQEEGSYDRVVITFTLTAPDGTESAQTFYFAVKEEDITPYSTSDRTDWSPVTWTEERWDFHMFPRNITDSTLEYVGSYSVNYNDGLPISSGFFGKSSVNTKALKEIQTLLPGDVVHYQTGITHRFNRSDEQEHTMVYKDEQGELYLQTFRFALDEAHTTQGPVSIYHYVYEECGVVRLETPEALAQEIGSSQYTRQEIRQMIDEGLTLEEWSDKLTSISDVQQFLLEAGVEFKGGDIKRTVDGIMWHFNDSAEVVFRQNYGNCGSGSSLINFLLQGDYAEQGYLTYAETKGGHVFNYFRKDDQYFIFDWSQRRDNCFTVCVADSLEDYADALIRTNHSVEKPQMHHRILLLYAYPYEGNARPTGDSKVIPRAGAPLMSTLAAEIEDSLTVLYVEEPQYAPVFTELPEVSLWPEDAR